MWVSATAAQRVLWHDSLIKLHQYNLLLKLWFNALTQGRKKIGINIGKTETKPVAFTTNMIIYLENLRGSIHSASYSKN